MSDLVNMELSDLERLKEDYIYKIDRLNSTIEDITLAIKTKKNLLDNKAIQLNPYYSNEMCVIKVSIDNDKYIVTKLTPNELYPNIVQFTEKDLNFLKNYDMCVKSEWDKAISKLNAWIELSGIKLVTV